MIAAIKLEGNLSCETICNLLQKAVVKYQKNNNLNDSLLVFDIVKISDVVDEIPKLEHKELVD